MPLQSGGEALTFRLVASRKSMVLALCGTGFVFHGLWRQQAARRSGRRIEKDDDMAITGTVKFFNSDKGYGFIQPDDGGTDAFVHISAVERAGLATLSQDQRLAYELETGRNGRVSAINLQPQD